LPNADKSSGMWVGAGATHAEVAGSAAVRRHLPVLADLVGHIGDPAVRHRGDLGGALAANEPARIAAITSVMSMCLSR